MILIHFLKRILVKSPKTISVKPKKTSLLESDSNTVSIIKTLQEHGHQAFLVGGCIRDSLLNLKPKDFDLATNATPEQVKKIIKSSRIIGKRFRLVHAYINRKTYEIATFRKSHSNTKKHSNPKTHSTSHSGLILRDNIFGNQKEDAVRRDFTINALYYDPTEKVIIDYHNGLKDIKRKTIKFIGDPKTRIIEDPVRMLRAIRFSNKLNFKIHPSITKLINNLASRLADIPPARLLEEYNKLFLHGSSLSNFKDLEKYGLLQFLFPIVKKHMRAQPQLKDFFHLACSNTDKRINKKLGINPAFLIALFLWPQYQQQLNSDLKSNKTTDDYELKNIRQTAADITLRKQTQTITLTQRMKFNIKDIWALQPDLEQHSASAISDQMFRAAFDFLMLRQELDNIPNSTIEFWRPYQLQAQQQANNRRRSYDKSNYKSNYKSKYKSKYKSNNLKPKN